MYGFLDSRLVVGLLFLCTENGGGCCCGEGCPAGEVYGRKANGLAYKNTVGTDICGRGAEVQKNIKQCRRGIPKTSGGKGFAVLKKKLSGRGVYGRKARGLAYKKYSGYSLHGRGTEVQKNIKQHRRDIPKVSGGKGFAVLKKKLSGRGGLWQESTRFGIQKI